MSSNFYSGNAFSDGSSSTPAGWFLGAFVSPNTGLRYSSAVEVKWGVHRAGEEKQSVNTNEHATTLAILISGRFDLQFPALDTRVEMKTMGDYVVFASGVQHHWKAVEDSVVLTVRWPSEKR